jgi:hypothetical protein
MTQILVTSASGTSGSGYGAIIDFSGAGAFIRPFSLDPRVTDPRGLSLDLSGELVYVNSGADRVLALDLRGRVALDSGRIDGLDPGGATFGPDGRYYVGLRRRRTVLAFPPRFDSEGEAVLPDGIVPFPRGFGFGPNGDLYLASGVGPSGEGDNTIVVFDDRKEVRTPRLVDDPELSPLDLAFAPNGNIVVSSEWPFGAMHATATVREYDHSTGAWSAYSRLTPRWGSQSSVDCDSVQTDGSIASGKITLSLSISVRAPTSVSSRSSRDSTARHLAYPVGQNNPSSTADPLMGAWRALDTSLQNPYKSPTLDVVPNPVIWNECAGIQVRWQFLDQAEAASGRWTLEMGLITRRCRAGVDSGSGDGPAGELVGVTPTGG